MVRADRLQQILQILHRHPAPVAGSVIADALSVTLRTITRDIASLQAGGADITGQSDPGYVLKPGFDLPPLVFSQHQVGALMAGLRQVTKQEDVALAASARAAMAKIMAVLPPELRNAPVKKRLSVGPPEPVGTIEEIQALLRDAIQREVKIGITYSDRNYAATRRIIWPFAFAYFSDAECAAAWCEKRADFRHFRLDRITGLSLSNIRYPRRRRTLVKEWREYEEQYGDFWY